MADVQIAVRTERVPKVIYYAELCRLVKINQNVSAKNNVHISDAVVVLEIVIVKTNRTHQIFVRLIARVRLGEKAAQIFRRDSVHARRGIKALLAHHQGFERQIRRDDLEIISGRQNVLENHRQRVRLFACRTARAPNFHGMAARFFLVFQDMRNDIIYQRVEMWLVSEKPRQIRGDRIKHDFHFFAVGNDQLVIFVHGIEFFVTQPLFETAVQNGAIRRRKSYSAFVVNRFAKFFKLFIRQ